MLSRQEEQAERRRVLANDQRVKEQTGTFLSHTHDDIHQGRFAAIGPAVVVGADPVPNYPAAASHQRDPCGPEPPLGYRIDAMPELEPLEPSSFTQGQLPNSVCGNCSVCSLGRATWRRVGAFSRTYGRSAHVADDVAIRQGWRRSH
jgi:hypothetical protein